MAAILKIWWHAPLKGQIRWGPPLILMSTCQRTRVPNMLLLSTCERSKCLDPVLHVFTFTGPKYWNSLPPSLTQIKSIYTFRRRLKKLILEYRT